MLATATGFAVAARPTAAAGKQTVTITPASHPMSASEAHFTGTVHISTPVETPAPARVFGGTVAFEPCARTAWHTHPLGQTLIVADGQGWVQQVGRPAQAIKTGDVVWIPPGVRHWHGAAAATVMTHVAIVEQLDGRNVTWMEKVSDAEYPS